MPVYFPMLSLGGLVHMESKFATISSVRYQVCGIFSSQYSSLSRNIFDSSFLIFQSHFIATLFALKCVGGGGADDREGVAVEGD